MHLSESICLKSVTRTGRVGSIKLLGRFSSGSRRMDGGIDETNS
jgi:hypothetical protein